MPCFTKRTKKLQGAFGSALAPEIGGATSKTHRNQAGIWYMVKGIQYIVYAIWNLVSGIWYMEYRRWYMVYGI